MRSLLVASLLLTACGDTPPAKLALDPKGPFSFTKIGEIEQVKVAAFDGKGMPYTRKGAVPVEYSSSDESVVKVSPSGEIMATGSGKAQVKATAWGIDTTADASVRIVGSIEVVDPAGTTKKAPKHVRLKDKPFPVRVVVKDDKGVVIEKPKVLYKALDYCVETDDEGVLTPLTEGECGVRVTAADKSATLWLDVKE
jgi:hypothetical protein